MREEELLFCAWENFPRAALCRAVADSQLISVGEREREARANERVLLGNSKPILSGFDFDRREIEAVYKFIWLSRCFSLSIRFDFAPIRFNLVQSTCRILYTRASQSENANYFRALFFAAASPMTRNFLCAACIILFIHNDETTHTHKQQRLPETINSRLVFVSCRFSLALTAHGAVFFTASRYLATR
jgi:hypothetical protein